MWQIVFLILAFELPWSVRGIQTVLVRDAGCNVNHGIVFNLNTTWNATFIVIDPQQRIEEADKFDYVRLTSLEYWNMFGLNADFTVEIWFQVTRHYDGQDPALVSYKNKREGWFQGWTVGITQDGTRVSVNVGDDQFQADLTSISTFDIGEWHHVTVTFDRSANMTLYLDGEFQSTTDISFLKEIRTGQYIILGNDLSLVYTPLYGALDEFRLWKGLRTPTQIRESFTRTLSGDEDNLVSWVPFRSLFVDPINYPNGELLTGDHGPANAIGRLQMMMTVDLSWGDGPHWLAPTCTGTATSSPTESTATMSLTMQPRLSESMVESDSISLSMSTPSTSLTPTMAMSPSMSPSPSTTPSTNLSTTLSIENTVSRTLTMDGIHTPTAIPSFTATSIHGWTGSPSPTESTSSTVTASTQTRWPTRSRDETLSMSMEATNTKIATLSMTFNKTETPPPPLPTPTPNRTLTPSNSRTTTSSRTSTLSPTTTRTPTRTPTDSHVWTGTATAPPTHTPTHSYTSTIILTRTLTLTPTGSRTTTQSPTFTSNPTTSSTTSLTSTFDGKGGIQIYTVTGCDGTDPLVCRGGDMLTFEGINFPLDASEISLKFEGGVGGPPECIGIASNSTQYVCALQTPLGVYGTWDTTLIMGPFQFPGVPHVVAIASPSLSHLTGCGSSPDAQCESGNVITLHGTDFGITLNDVDLTWKGGSGGPVQCAPLAVRPTLYSCGLVVDPTVSGVWSVTMTIAGSEVGTIPSITLIPPLRPELSGINGCAADAPCQERDLLYIYGRNFEPYIPSSNQVLFVGTNTSQGGPPSCDLTDTTQTTLTCNMALPAGTAGYWTIGVSVMGILASENFTIQLKGPMPICNASKVCTYHGCLIDDECLCYNDLANGYWRDTNCTECLDLWSGANCDIAYGSFKLEFSTYIFTWSSSGAARATSLITSIVDTDNGMEWLSIEEVEDPVPTARSRYLVEVSAGEGPIRVIADARFLGDNALELQDKLLNLVVTGDQGLDPLQITRMGIIQNDESVKWYSYTPSGGEGGGAPGDGVVSIWNKWWPLLLGLCILFFVCCYVWFLFWLCAKRAYSKHVSEFSDLDDVAVSAKDQATQKNWDGPDALASRSLQRAMPPLPIQEVGNGITVPASNPLSTAYKKSESETPSGSSKPDLKSPPILTGRATQENAVDKMIRDLKAEAKGLKSVNGSRDSGPLPKGDIHKLLKMMATNCEDILATRGHRDYSNIKEGLRYTSHGVRETSGNAQDRTYYDALPGSLPVDDVITPGDLPDPFSHTIFVESQQVEGCKAYTLLMASNAIVNWESLVPFTSRKECEEGMAKIIAECAAYFEATHRSNILELENQARQALYESLHQCPLCPQSGSKSTVGTAWEHYKEHSAEFVSEVHSKLSAENARMREQTYGALRNLEKDNKELSRLLEDKTVTCQSLATQGASLLKQLEHVCFQKANLERHLLEQTVTLETSLGDPTLDLSPEEPKQRVSSDSDGPYHLWKMVATTSVPEAVPIGSGSEIEGQMAKYNEDIAKCLAAFREHMGSKKDLTIYDMGNKMEKEILDFMRDKERQLETVRKERDAQISELQLKLGHLHFTKDNMMMEMMAAKDREATLLQSQLLDLQNTLNGEGRNYDTIYTEKLELERQLLLTQQDLQAREADIYKLNQRLDAEKHFKQMQEEDLKTLEEDIGRLEAQKMEVLETSIEDLRHAVEEKRKVVYHTRADLNKAADEKMELLKQCVADIREMEEEKRTLKEKMAEDFEAEKKRIADEGQEALQKFSQDKRDAKDTIKVLEDELARKTQEAFVLKHENTLLDSQHNDLIDRCNQLSKDIEETEALKEELQKFKDLTTIMAKERNKFVIEIQELSEQKMNVSQQCQERARDVAYIEGQLASLLQEKRETQETINAWHAELPRLKANVDNMKAGKTDTELRLASALDEVPRYQLACERMTAEIKVLEDQVGSLLEEKRVAQGTIDVLALDVAKYKGKVDAMKEGKEDVKAAIQGHADMAGQLQAAIQENAALERLNEALEKDKKEGMQKLQHRIEAKHMEMHQRLEETHMKLRTEYEAEMAKMQESYNTKIKAMEDNVEDVRRQMDAAIAAKEKEMNHAAARMHEAMVTQSRDLKLALEVPQKKTTHAMYNPNPNSALGALQQAFVEQEQSMQGTLAEQQDSMNEVLKQIYQSISGRNHKISTAVRDINRIMDRKSQQMPDPQISTPSAPSPRDSLLAIREAMAVQKQEMQSAILEQKIEIDHSIVALQKLLREAIAEQQRQPMDSSMTVALSTTRHEMENAVMDVQRTLRNKTKELQALLETQQQLIQSQATDPNPSQAMMANIRVAMATQQKEIEKMLLAQQRDMARALASLQVTLDKATPPQDVQQADGFTKNALSTVRIEIKHAVGDVQRVLAEKAKQFESALKAQVDTLQARPSNANATQIQQALLEQQKELESVMAMQKRELSNAIVALQASLDRPGLANDRSSEAAWSLAKQQMDSAIADIQRIMANKSDSMDQTMLARQRLIVSESSVASLRQEIAGIKNQMEIVLSTQRTEIGGALALIVRQVDEASATILSSHNSMATGQPSARRKEAQQAIADIQRVIARKTREMDNTLEAQSRLLETHAASHRSHPDGSLAEMRQAIAIQQSQLGEALEQQEKDIQKAIAALQSSIQGLMQAQSEGNAATKQEMENAVVDMERVMRTKTDDIDEVLGAQQRLIEAHLESSNLSNVGFSDMLGTIGNQRKQLGNMLTAQRREMGAALSSFQMSLDKARGGQRSRESAMADSGENDETLVQTSKIRNSVAEFHSVLHQKSWEMDDCLKAHQALLKSAKKVGQSAWQKEETVAMRHKHVRAASAAQQQINEAIMALQNSLHNCIPNKEQKSGRGEVKSRLAIARTQMDNALVDIQRVLVDKMKSMDAVLTMQQEALGADEGLEELMSEEGRSEDSFPGRQISTMVENTLTAQRMEIGTALTSLEAALEQVTRSATEHESLALTARKSEIQQAITDINRILAQKTRDMDIILSTHYKFVSENMFTSSNLDFMLSEIRKNMMAQKMEMSAALEAERCEINIAIASIQRVIPNLLSYRSQPMDRTTEATLAVIRDEMENAVVDIQRVLVQKSRDVDDRLAMQLQLIESEMSLPNVSTASVGELRVCIAQQQEQVEIALTAERREMGAALASLQSSLDKVAQIQNTAPGIRVPSFDMTSAVLMHDAATHQATFARTMEGCQRQLDLFLDSQQRYADKLLSSVQTSLAALNRESREIGRVPSRSRQTLSSILGGAVAAQQPSLGTAAKIREKLHRTAQREIDGALLHLGTLIDAKEQEMATVLEDMYELYTNIQSAILPVGSPLTLTKQPKMFEGVRPDGSLREGVDPVPAISPVYNYPLVDYQMTLSLQQRELDGTLAEQQRAIDRKLATQQREMDRALADMRAQVAKQQREADTEVAARQRDLVGTITKMLTLATSQGHGHDENMKLVEDRLKMWQVDMDTVVSTRQQILNQVLLDIQNELKTKQEVVDAMFESKRRELESVFGQQLNNMEQTLSSIRTAIEEERNRMVGGQNFPSSPHFKDVELREAEKLASAAGSRGTVGGRPNQKASHPSDEGVIQVDDLPHNMMDEAGRLLEEQERIETQDGYQLRAQAVEFDKEAKRYMAQIKKWEALCVSLQETEKKMAGDMEKLETENGSLKEEVKRMSYVMTSLEAKTFEYETKLSEAERHVVSLAEGSKQTDLQWQARIERATQQLDTRHMKTEELEEEIKRMDMLLNSRSQKVEELEEEKKALYARVDHVQERLDNHRSTIHYLEAEVDQLKESLKHAHDAIAKSSEDNVQDRIDRQSYEWRLRQEVEILTEENRRLVQQVSSPSSHGHGEMAMDAKFLATLSPEDKIALLQEFDEREKATNDLYEQETLELRRTRANDADRLKSMEMIIGRERSKISELEARLSASEDAWKRQTNIARLQDAVDAMTRGQDVRDRLLEQLLEDKNQAEIKAKRLAAMADLQQRRTATLYQQAQSQIHALEAELAFSPKKDATTGRDTHSEANGNPWRVEWGGNKREIEKMREDVHIQKEKERERLKLLIANEQAQRVSENIGTSSMNPSMTAKQKAHLEFHRNSQSSLGTPESGLGHGVISVEGCPFLDPKDCPFFKKRHIQHMDEQEDRLGLG